MAADVLDWIKQRARSDPQMRRAAERRRAEPGGIKDADDTELATVLTRQHNQVTALVKQLSTIPGVKRGGSEQQRARRGSIVDMIADKLSRHESVEEELLWPMVRVTLSDGDGLADTALEQEQQTRDLLRELGKLSPDVEKFDELVEELVLRLRQHVSHEDQVFLKLREHLDLGQRRKVGKRLERARRAGSAKRQGEAPGKAAGRRRPAVAVEKAANKAGEKAAAPKKRAARTSAPKRDTPETTEGEA